MSCGGCSGAVERVLKKLDGKFELNAEYRPVIGVPADHFSPHARQVIMTGGGGFFKDISCHLKFITLDWDATLTTHRNSTV